MISAGEFQEPFRLLAVDPSLRRSGFAILDVNPILHTVSVHSVFVIDNRHKHRHRPRECLLQRIKDITRNLVMRKDISVFAREGGILWANDSVREVCSVMDLALWEARRETFYDITAPKVKKIITGVETANKHMVADSLGRYVGLHTYACDDQSDAVAVGVSWLKLMGLIDGTEHRECYEQEEIWPYGLALQPLMI